MNLLSRGRFSRCICYQFQISGVEVVLVWDHGDGSGVVFLVAIYILASKS